MVGFGHRIGRTLAYPAGGCAAVVPAGRPVTAAATGSAVALSTPSLLAALHPTPVADAQPALPRLALGPLAATAPHAHRGRARDRAREARRRRAGHVHRRGARPGVEQGALAAHARHPARPRLDREADHHVGRAAHAQPDVQPGHHGSWRAGQPGGGRARGRRRPHAHRAPAGQGRRLPRPGPAHRRSPTQVKKATGGRGHQGDDRHQPLPRAGPRAGLGRGRHRGRATSPRSPR